MGVPHSTGNGTTERDQHLGPRAVRNISAMLKRSHFDYKIDPWRENKIHDLGDVPFPEANNNEKCIERISAFYDLIEQAEKPVVSLVEIILRRWNCTSSYKNSKLQKKKITFLHLMHIQTVLKIRSLWCKKICRIGIIFSKARKCGPSYKHSNWN